ncbi:MAG: nitrile hydratase subunit alpha [Chloroflexi bacterium]|nr:nitrile hydratase subunit alpha [Chloroflexota bacterium]MCH8114436.1 nitrile hydratase subunit alpha [Chloroflexota bacterium]MCI0775258.1 nitrile hydratase subunit alpha [Chloroflexota bacterium]MCI0803016.1 nitrile hydratase subunit alpha [Chloroflexota bacterium]MCI0808271.1 nitrile hydratase subunit alpha [Chloroflexota bacterium]
MSNHEGEFYDTGWRPKNDVHRDEDGRPHDHPGLQEDTSLGVRAARALAMHELLVEKGVIGPSDVDEDIAARGNVVPGNGAALVAKAWVAPEFKATLLAHPKQTIAEAGFVPEHNADIIVLENTSDVQYMVVCTLCSCYPGRLLGPPPDWYKSLEYRSRAVREPRKIMSEFGLELAEDVEVRVVDSNSELRFFVIPLRPPGTEGWSEDELANLVTRDSMIGVSAALTPDAVNA